MGDGVNIAARLEGIAKPGPHLLPVRGTLTGRSRGGSISRSSDLGQTELKNITEPDQGLFARGRREPSPRCSTQRQLRSGRKAGAAIVDRSRPAVCEGRAATPKHEHFVDGVTGDPDHRPRANCQFVHRRAKHRLHVQGQVRRRQAARPRIERSLYPGRHHPARREPYAGQRAAHRRDDRPPSLGGPVRQADG